MRAEILAVGSELLTPLRSDTNALQLTAKLREIGIEVVARVTVADDLALLESAFRSALSRAEVVIATGGLGPTEDDLTREALAAAVGRPIRRHPGLLAALKERFAQYRREMAPVNEKQADLIEGAQSMPNPKGSAPGQALEIDGRLVLLLPGPPREMEAMFEAGALPLLRQRAGLRVIKTRVLKIAALGESEVEQLVAPLYTTFTNPRTTILGAPGQVELHLTAEGASDEEAQERIEALATGLRTRLAGRIFSEDGRELHQVVAGLLAERGLTLALAESCTGGLLAARLTEVPGASAFLERGYVTYSNQSKIDLLGVDPQVLETQGAVSEEVARAMADGARRAAGSHLGLAVTGIAGPTGATPAKPLGLVFIAQSGVLGDRLRRLHFPGGRARVRYQACQAALEMLRRSLLGLSGA